jgi:hypothetical protein
MLRAVIPAFVLAAAMLVAIWVGLHLYSRDRSQAVRRVAGACTTPGGASVTGKLPASGRGTLTVVQILPADPYGATYLNFVRRKFGLPLRPAAALSTDEMLKWTSVLRYAQIDRAGRFSCRSLEAGRYFAVASTSRGPGQLSVNVAAFDVGPGRTASVGETNFKPLQAIQ